jgi:hypothetical protein
MSSEQMSFSCGCASVFPHKILYLAFCLHIILNHRGQCILFSVVFTSSPPQSPRQCLAFLAPTCHLSTPNLHITLHRWCGPAYPYDYWRDFVRTKKKTYSSFMFSTVQVLYLHPGLGPCPHSDEVRCVVLLVGLLSAHICPQLKKPG